MNIFKKDQNSKYTSTSKRSFAASIDVIIVLILRVIAMQFMGLLWINQKLVDFMQEFSTTFGTMEVKNTPEHLNFVFSHSIFWNVLFFYFITLMVGAFYHAYLNSSNWQATIGKRLNNIMITNANEGKISFKRALLHYFLAIMPFIYLTYIMAYQVRHQISVSQALMGSEINIVLGIIFVLWIQIQAFTPRKTTAYDLICNTVLINGKTNFKLPWNK
jgi:uncharacterized RDD family membrane protein YckC